MITQTLTWSTDITKAPKGEMVTTTFTVMIKGEPKERTKTEHVPAIIMVLSECGKILRSYWIPGKPAQSGAVLDGDRWSGFNRGQSPVAWAAWPDAADLLASIAGINAVGMAERLDGGTRIVHKHVFPELPIIEDVGGSV